MPKRKNMLAEFLALDEPAGFIFGDNSLDGIGRAFGDVKLRFPDDLPQSSNIIDRRPGAPRRPEPAPDAGPGYMFLPDGTLIGVEELPEMPDMFGPDVERAIYESEPWQHDPPRGGPDAVNDMDRARLRDIIDKYFEREVPMPPRRPPNLDGAPPMPPRRPSGLDGPMLMRLLGLR